MRLIDADKLRIKWIWGDTDRSGHTECIELADLDNAPTISADEGVRIIWSAQIDELIAKMESLKGRKDNSVQYERGISDCIRILEEAKG